eukprot:CAMPEP_0172904482 /NCGR_PEP_ID=MMETSP1075-20121228/172712_1 /TAXON_ID=2916 /ORGANISM="Ceratium fusus, Strain PA161109" /LENGTH=54 /DNA_ID=CAMNT_0013761519 /DNA_START=29 /DNA_END=190 /DNA_ORIENTATION=-
MNGQRAMVGSCNTRVQHLHTSCSNFAIDAKGLAQTAGTGKQQQRPTSSQQATSK